MVDQRATLEVIAPTVEEAIEKGLLELGVEREHTEIDVLDEGSQGLFGLGSRQARIRISIKQEELVITQDSVIPDPDFYHGQDEEVGLQAGMTKSGDDQDHHVLTISREILEELLTKMGVTAEVDVSFGEDETGRTKPVKINVNGDDLSILIGRNGETLDALQFITKLIVGKELGRSVSLSIDVEGYRARREKQLQNLARKMAEQVIATGRNFALEPMTPAERRIVHIELRNYEGVYTESLGDGNRRKVVVYPKN